MMTRTEPIEIKKQDGIKAFDPGLGGNNNPTNNSLWKSEAIRIEQLETIYVMDLSGTLRPYLEVRKVDVDKVMFDRSLVKTKIVDKKAFQEQTEVHYNTLVRYTKENDLDFEKKEDLIKILDYHKTLIE